jgi:hypothetical protein
MGHMSSPDRYRCFARPFLTVFNVQTDNNSHTSIRVQKIIFSQPIQSLPLLGICDFDYNSRILCVVMLERGVRLMLRVCAVRSVVDWEMNLGGTGWAYLLCEKSCPVWPVTNCFQLGANRVLNTSDKYFMYAGRHANDESMPFSVVVISARFLSLTGASLVP